LRRLKECVVEVPDEVTSEAIRYRVNNRRKGISYADCLGYAYSKHFGFLFLTGDDAFNGLSGVEFVK
jgi:hypothetical protein